MHLIVLSQKILTRIIECILERTHWLLNTTTTVIDTESGLVAARREGVGGLGEKGEGLRSTNWRSQNSPEDVKYSIGNIVSNIVTATYGARWVLETAGGTLGKGCD